MSDTRPTLLFVPGAWHRPSCYDKVIKLLQDQYKLRCISITLPSTQNNPSAGMKDDIDAAREAVLSETTLGRDVVVIAHSYGGLVGNSCIKGLTRPSAYRDSAAAKSRMEPEIQHTRTGHVVGLVLIATGFNFTGYAMLDPFLGYPPPFMRANKSSGYFELAVDPRDFFYHDLPQEEAEHQVSQLTTQSIKSQVEDGQYAYAGWQDVPTWYIGTAEDRGLPVFVQRMSVGMARSQGATVHHTELRSSHSPFLSMPEEVSRIIANCAEILSVCQDQTKDLQEAEITESSRVLIPNPKLFAPFSWLRFGIPLVIGRFLGWTFFGVLGLRNFVKRTIWSHEI